MWRSMLSLSWELSLGELVSVGFLVAWRGRGLHLFTEEPVFVRSLCWLFSSCLSRTIFHHFLP